MKTFRNMVLLICLILISSMVVHSDSDTGALSFSGYVQEVVNVVIVPKKVNTYLVFSPEAQQVTLATISESSNLNGSYVIKARSKNNGEFKTSEHKDTVPYSVSYGDGARLNLAGGEKVLKGKSTSGISSAFDSDLEVLFGGKKAESFRPGPYSDTITLTIEGQ